MHIKAKEETEDSVKEGMEIVRKRAGSMFKALASMHKIMEAGCEISLEDRQVNFVIEEGNPEVDAWLKDFNKEVDKMVKEDDIDPETDGPIDLKESMEAMTFYITLLLHQIVPADMIRDACIHHATEHIAMQGGPENALASVIREVLAHSGTPTPGDENEPWDDPFKDVPELDEGAPVVVQERTPKDDS